MHNQMPNTNWTNGLVVIDLIKDCVNWMDSVDDVVVNFGISSIDILEITYR